MYVSELIYLLGHLSVLLLWVYTLKVVTDTWSLTFTLSFMLLRSHCVMCNWRAVIGLMTKTFFDEGSH